jgi:hypothetical protein
MRKRVPGYITQEKSNDFGMDTRVQRPTGDGSSGFPASGNPVAEGAMANNENLQKDVGFRNVIPPGEIGSEAKGDLDILTLRQHLDTAPYMETETRPQELHGSVNVQRVARGTETPFNSYATFTPRRAPMPRNAGDEGFLQGPPDLAADPLMTDADSSELFFRRPTRTESLYGSNRDGVLKAENAKSEKIKR